MPRIDLDKVEAQLSVWQTDQPPETFWDEDEIVMSDEFSQKCYFVAHRNGKEFQVDWNLADNFDICQNPQLSLQLFLKCLKQLSKRVSPTH